MATILLSIKPEYVAKIFDHTKLFEYRKRIPQKPVEIVVVYSSIPEQIIVGEFEVLEIVKMKPTQLWNSTKKVAGITRAKYREYFQRSEIAYAYRIGRTTLYDSPKLLKDYGIDSAPQSFFYLKGD